MFEEEVYLVVEAGGGPQEGIARRGCIKMLNQPGGECRGRVREVSKVGVG